MRTKVTLLLIVSSLCLYVASLFLPAFTCAHTKSFPGYVVLMIGYMGVLGFDPRWFGNIGFALLLFASVKAEPRFRPRILGATALLAIASLAQAAGCEGGGGAPEVSTGLALGGYLWVAALLFACVANLSLLRTENPDSGFTETRPEKHV